MLRYKSDTTETFCWRIHSSPNIFEGFTWNPSINQKYFRFFKGASELLDEQVCLDTAEKAAAFIKAKMVTEDGRLLRRFREEEAMAVMNLLRMGRLLQDEGLTEKGVKVIAAQADIIRRHPTGFTYLLTALNYAQAPGEFPPSCTTGGSCGLE